MIKFDQNVWQNPYININTDLRKKAKSNFQKDFFKLMNKSIMQFLETCLKLEKT